MNITRIFTSAKDANTALQFAYEIGDTVNHYFPEVHQGLLAMPLSNEEILANVSTYLNCNIVTMSEVVIRALLREVRRGTTALELWCDDINIGVDEDGSLLSPWPGDHFDTDFNLLFVE